MQRDDDLFAVHILQVAVRKSEKAYITLSGAGDPTNII